MISGSFSSGRSITEAREWARHRPDQRDADDSPPAACGPSLPTSARGSWYKGNCTHNKQVSVMGKKRGLAPVNRSQ